MADTLAPGGRWLALEVRRRGIVMYFRGLL